MKKQVYVDERHEYDYDIIEDTIHTLYYSLGDHWSTPYRGEIAFQIQDDGNGLIILTKFTQKNRINYSEAEYMFIMLKLINQPAKYEIGTKQLL